MLNRGMPIRAVLFDVDGTLLDTTEFIYQGFDHALTLANLRPRTRAEYATVMGKSLAATYELLVPGCDAEALCEVHRSWQDRNLHLAMPFPDAALVLLSLIHI